MTKQSLLSVMPLTQGRLQRTGLCLNRSCLPFITGALCQSKRYRGDIPTGFGRVDLHFVPKRRVDQYPIPTDATHWLGHQKPQYCTTFTQEMSAYQTKVFWTYYMHSAGRLWNRFACCWWSWAWPATVCMGTILVMALRNQRIERVRTWH